MFKLPAMCHVLSLGLKYKLNLEHKKSNKTLQVLPRGVESSDMRTQVRVQLIMPPPKMKQLCRSNIQTVFFFDDWAGIHGRKTMKGEEKNMRLEK